MSRENSFLKTGHTFNRMNHNQAIRTAITFILLVFAAGCHTARPFPETVTRSGSDSVFVNHLVTDTLFHSHQSIYIVALNRDFFNDHTFGIGYSPVKDQLEKTSWIARRYHATAAINGSFFDMDKGGGVTYIENNDSVISRPDPSDVKWVKPDSLANGAIVLTKRKLLKIGPAKSARYYEKSKKENFAMITGPLLIKNSKAQKLPDMKFSNHRYPRTCLCKTRHAILLVAIDGRSRDAVGMSLEEAQKFLKSLGCTDAINLDGGGSTTLWTNSRGVVNHPSDKQGERPVANALLILKNK